MINTKLFIRLYTCTCIFICTIGRRQIVHGQQGACPQFTPNSPPMGTYSCPGGNITYTCALSSNLPAVTTVWSGTAFQCPSRTISLNQRTYLEGFLPFMLMSCGSLSAVTTNISNDGLCYTSVLTIPAVQTLNGTTVMCVNGVTGTVVGNNTVIVKLIASPGSFRTMTLNSTFVSVLTVTWTPPTTGGTPASYNVSINDSSSPVVILDNGSSLYTHTFTGLISDTLYTVSVVAINCAGTSNVTSKTRLTVADPPNSNSIRTTFILYVNNTLCLLNITWTPVGGSVTMYTVRVVAGDGTSAGHGSANCTTSPCLYFIYPEISAFATNSTIFLASINGDGDVGPENSSTISVINSITAVNSGVSDASIQCSFWDNQSYCLVCCSTDPSVPPDSSVYNISTSRGTEVTVDLDGLTSGQMYYCKAAATNNNSNSQNCTFPGFGDVNVFISFRTLHGTTGSGITTQISVRTVLAVLLSTAATIAVIVTITVVSIIYVMRTRKAHAHTCTGDKSERSNAPVSCNINLGMYEEINLSRTHSEHINEITRYSPYYKAPADTGHIYGVLENPNDNKAISLHTGKALNPDKVQHVTMPITDSEDSYSISTKKAKTADNADLVSQVQAEYEDVLSPANDGGYALPVDHKGIRLKTGT